MAPDTGASDEFGEVTFSLKNAEAGCYTTKVTDINGDTSVTTPAIQYGLRTSCP